MFEIIVFFSVCALFWGLSELVERFPHLKLIDYGRRLKLLAAALVGFIFGGFFGWVSIGHMLDSYDLAKNGVEVTGAVVSSKREARYRRKRTSAYYANVISYDHYTRKIEEDFQRPIGQSLVLVYSLKNPSNVRHTRAKSGFIDYHFDDVTIVELAISYVLPIVCLLIGIGASSKLFRSEATLDTEGID